MRRLLCCGLFLALAACTTGIETPDSDGTWVGTITTEGNVTTVINESGSVWGGTATLVEEASIGVESGADEYMFGSIDAIYADDQRIYVADGQVPIVRVYDLEGTFITDIGGGGEGPGEYSYPGPITAAADGRVFVLDARHARVNVYTPDGEPLDTWPGAVSICCSWPMFLLGPERLWVPGQERYDEENPTDRTFGFQAIGPEGPLGPVSWVPKIELRRSTFVLRGFPEPTPFSPWLVWNATPDGGMLFGGSDRYRFELLHGDGSRLVVERYWDPVPVPAEHKEWERKNVVGFHREWNEPTFSWDGATMPDHKPAYIRLSPALSGEVWVLREGASEQVPDCIEDPIEAGYRAAIDQPCWRSNEIMDVFGPDGRYLGEVGKPQGMRAWLRSEVVVDGRRVIASVEDEAGTIRVKRYRMVLPGEGAR